MEILTHKRWLLKPTAVSSTLGLSCLTNDPPTLQNAETQYTQPSTRYLDGAKCECTVGSHLLP